jgi:hypothetical protein
MYVHYNPVKHGLVTEAHDWPYSTSQRYEDSGVIADPEFTDDVMFQMECE